MMKEGIIILSMMILAFVLIFMVDDDAEEE